MKMKKIKRYDYLENIFTSIIRPETTQETLEQILKRDLS
jgi:hypothetical protein